MRIASIRAEALSVPLREPFVIASGRVDATRAALVEITLEDASGRVAHGMGEAAALPPVTREDQPDLLRAIAAAARDLTGGTFEHIGQLASALDAALGATPVARAGLECALLDAWARLTGVPVYRLLGGRMLRRLVTDMTLPIASPARMAELAMNHRARGFNSFKVKVGKSLDDDVRALLGVHARVPDATFRLDANAAFTAAEALELVAKARAAGLHLECFEQPCARDDLEGMAQVAREGGLCVLADESVRNEADLVRVIAAGAAHGVNLKLAKSGGMIAALALGRRARAAGLVVMCGGMVETRLGMTAMAHVACALERVEFVDLDTAFLLSDDPFEGGYRARGAELELTPGAGFDVRRRAPG
jgi:L-alanine-DL-glutamate epimerase-like enolase superfamily enzyme